jgi:hypothetical protein
LRESRSETLKKWKGEGRKENFMPGIKDKVVVITGASSELRKFSGAGSGIGDATAVMLAERRRSC